MYRQFNFELGVEELVDQHFAEQNPAIQNIRERNLKKANLGQVDDEDMDNAIDENMNFDKNIDVK